MMRRLTFVLILILATNTLVAQSQDSVLGKILDQGLNHSKVMEPLDHLANLIGPRLTGSMQLQAAVDWTLEQFRALGLKARKEKWGTIAVGFNRGPWRGEMVSPRRLPLTFGTNAWTVGTRGRQLGPAILGPASEEDWKERSSQVSGCWIVEGKTRRSKAGDLSQEQRLKLRRQRRAWRRKRLKLYAQAGALGVIRSTGGKLVQTSGKYRVPWQGWAPLPQINMVKADFLAITRALEQGEVVLEFDIRNHFQKGPIPVYNVIADIPGREFPDQYVIVGGHLDSWDGATGATDNGTGVASTLEAARILMAAGARPRRTIRFMLWSGEEQGLLGSRAWCQQHQDVMEKISAAFIHDMGTNYVSGITVTAAQLADFETICAPLKDLEPEMPFKLRKARRGLRGMGSDHASFLAQGVPGFFWRQSGRAKYFFGHHTQNDTSDLVIPEYQRHTATVIATVSYGVANLDHLLSREGLRPPRR